MSERACQNSETCMFKINKPAQYHERTRRLKFIHYVIQRGAMFSDVAEIGVFIQQLSGLSSIRGLLVTQLPDRSVTVQPLALSLLFNLGFKIMKFQEQARIRHLEDMVEFKQNRPSF
jgi:hypothetical protein